MAVLAAVEVAAAAVVAEAVVAAEDLAVVAVMVAAAAVDLVVAAVEAVVVVVMVPHEMAHRPHLEVGRLPVVKTVSVVDEAVAAADTRPHPVGEKPLKSNCQ